MEDSENDEKQGDWSKLPFLPLQKVYSFLKTRQDQINMSLVCRTWSEGFCTPSVWETFQFNLTDSEISIDTCPEIKFARKYSRMFQHVEIVCRSINPAVFNTSSVQLKRFLDILTSNSQLRSIKFLSLGNYLLQVGELIYSELFEAVSNLLKSQHHLKRVEFRSCLFQFQKGVKLLSDLTENSSSSLTHLVLRDFVYDQILELEEDITAAQNLPALVSQRFPNLKTLEGDYSLIFDNMFAKEPALIETISKNCQMRELSKIILHCHGFRRSRFQGMTSAAWRFLRQLCPDLQVELYFVPGFGSQREREFFILPDMPITHLDYRLDRLHADIIIEINDVFNHLLACNTNNYLVSLYLIWMLPIHNFATTFTNFFQASTKLKSFQLFTVFPLNGIDALLSSWLENRPESLNDFIISISNIRNEDDYMSLMTLADEYLPILQVLGINIILIFDHDWQ